jgi:hypothetical protein
VTRRWRRQSFAVALSVGCGLMLASATTGTGPASDLRLLVALPDGTTLASVGLPADASFALRYRNSLYGTLAEERFVVTGDGELRLVELAADQLAVLEEYYAIDSPARAVAGARGWEATPAHVPVITQLRIAATDRGERTLLVEGAPPLELFRLVDDTEPTVVLELGP